MKLVFLVLLTASSLAAGVHKYNILHIHADDHRADGLHALGTMLVGAGIWLSQEE